jgi:aminopeptidase N
LVAFHRADGEGYKFLASWIKKVDTLNPQLAARTCTAFQNWKQFDNLRQDKISLELTKLLKVDKLSKDTNEMISRILNN